MSVEYKRLNLNREKIITTINHYCAIHDYDSDIPDNYEKRDETRNRLTLTIDTRCLFIDFHFNKDATTTIDDDFGGQNLDIKKEVCFHIRDNCLIGMPSNKNQWFVVEGVSEDDFNTTLQFIKESAYYRETISEDLQKSQYKYKGAYGENITISYYNQKNNKILIQGKPLLLYLDAKEIITNLVDYEGIPKVLNENFVASVDKDFIIEQSKLLLPNSYDKIWSEKLRKCILQAVYYMNLHDKMFDYTGLAFHGYRALEGHLRYVLKESGITLLGTNFDLFENKQLRSDFKKEVHSHISDHLKADNIIKYIEETYKYFGDKRHAYFHWNNPNITGIDDTRVIENEINAQGLIRESLNLIDDYFKI